MSEVLKLSSAVDRMGACPENAQMNAEADDKLTCLSPRVKYNEELNGYHFHFFNETFICREELPQGSKTFQQVLDEITQELDSSEISDKPARLPESNNRRKSVATCMIRKVDSNIKKRRVSWGKGPKMAPETITNCSSALSVSSSSSSSPFCRPRVCSDGAVVRRKSLKGRR